MSLHKIKDFDPDYRDLFDNQNILDYDLYSNSEKVGSVDDLLVDDDGRFRYLVIHTGLWIFGKRVLLPIGQARISHEERRIYAVGLTHQQVEHLPEYSTEMVVDHAQEERVRDVYRRPHSEMTTSTAVGAAELPVDQSAPLYASAPLEASAPLDTPAAPVSTPAVIPTANVPMAQHRSVNDTTVKQEREPEPDLYAYNDTNQPNLRLYEERLVANKLRRKAGEVTVGKRVETETAHIAVPVEREHIVIERSAPSIGTSTGTSVAPGEAFRDGEVARIELYEETPDIHKEAFVREEVRVSKAVEHEVVETEATLRREELDVSTEGNPQIEHPHH